ncbi:DUF222 domain-containing protein [Janibacter sp. G56]|uniref:HNH endonuclease signature motif containing protein n=1 Tax=Janibacter sp. G56 TaxID=3418717 RepID=UPI003D071791
MSSAALLPSVTDEVMSGVAAPVRGGLGEAIARGHAAVDDILAALAVEAAVGAERGPDGAQQRALLREVERLARRTEAARLRMIARAEASGVPERTGFADTGSWLSRQTMQNRSEAAADAAVASALGDEGDSSATIVDLQGGGVAGPSEPGSAGGQCAPVMPARGRSLTGQAFDQGDISSAHAKVIVGALRDLPEGVTAADRDACEAELLRLAVNRTPAQLRRIGRRILAQVEPDPRIVDAHEDAIVTAEEDRAWEAASFWSKDNHDGTMSGGFTVPWLAGMTLKKVLDAMTAPRRRTTDDLTGKPGRPSEPVDWKMAQLDWQHRRGTAFAELLARIPTDHLHDKVAATILVTADLDTLRGDVARAAGTDVAGPVSAGELRRTACGAGIVPAILGGASVPVDLGRQQRCFTTAQRVALSATYDECVADGCDRPLAWCELHHLTPWVAGGRTDLANAVPLCGRHHRAIDRLDTEHTVLRDTDQRVRIRFRRGP